MLFDLFSNFLNSWISSGCIGFGTNPTGLFNTLAISFVNSLNSTLIKSIIEVSLNIFCWLIIPSSFKYALPEGFTSLYNSTCFLVLSRIWNRCKTSILLALLLSQVKESVKKSLYTFGINSNLNPGKYLR